MTRVLFLIAIICFLTRTQAQQLPQPYILNGSATQRTCNCYVLTQDAQNTSGTAWNKNKIDLSQSFDYSFDVNLGSKDATGADGIGFILQTQGTNLGANGGGIGFQGISPSLGVIIDTWQNTGNNDPTYDHLAIQVNGNSDHNAATNLAGPVQVINGQDNIEDGQWHLFRIRWDAATFTMEVSIDNQLRLTATKDLVTDIFGGNPSVFWGFAGSTGGSSNLQQFCAALRPDFSFNSGQILCDGTPVTFTDNSSSFGVITRRFWDLGDGTTTTAIQPQPHVYPGPGNYQVRMVIEDNSGCISDTLRAPVTIGSYPVVDFGPSLICLGSTGTILDSTFVAVGTKERWEWDFGNGTTSSVQNPPVPYTAPGNYTVQLRVTTKEGCSTTDSRTLRAVLTPQIRAVGNNVCLGQFTDLQAASVNGVPIGEWYWSLGNGDTIRTQNVNYRYTAGGTYNTQAHAISTDGCPAVPIPVTVDVVDLQLDAGRDTIIAKGQPLQLNAQASRNNLQYIWSPSTGLSDPSISNPVAILQQDQTYIVTVISPEGCRDDDMIFIKAYKGPEFYVPTAFSPNGDGRNDIFRVIAPGVAKLDFFRIWNRWGEEVFQTADFTAGWDGNSKGRPAEMGTYVWMVQGTDYTGRTFSRQGTVTLIR